MGETWTGGERREGGGRDSCHATCAIRRFDSIAVELLMPTLLELLNFLLFFCYLHLFFIPEPSNNIRKRYLISKINVELLTSIIS